MYRAKLSQLFTLFFNEIGIRNSWIWRLNVCKKSESHEKAANVLFCWQRWWFLEEGGSCSQTEEGLLKTWNWRTIVRKSISLNLWVRTRTRCYSINSACPHMFVHVNILLCRFLDIQLPHPLDHIMNRGEFRVSYGTKA
jgi:hypothetical protein